jgi:hypothetical protein
MVGSATLTIDTSIGPRAAASSTPILAAELNTDAEVSSTPTSGHG